MIAAGATAAPVAAAKIMEALPKLTPQVATMIPKEVGWRQLVSGHPKMIPSGELNIEMLEDYFEDIFRKRHPSREIRIWTNEAGLSFLTEYLKRNFLKLPYDIYSKLG